MNYKERIYIFNWAPTMLLNTNYRNLIMNKEASVIKSINSLCDINIRRTLEKR